MNDRRLQRTCTKMFSMLQQRGGKKFTFSLKSFIKKGVKEKYVVGGWKLHSELVEISGFTWYIDIIDYFS